MKPTIVMLYGLLGDVEHFKAQQDYFGKDFNVYVPDWFTLCDSSHKRNACEAASASIVQHLIEKNINSPILVGHSMGGVLALDMVSRLQYPASKLVMLDTSITLAPEKKAAYRSLCEQLSANSNNHQFVADFFRQRFFSEKDNQAMVEHIIDQITKRLNPLWFTILAGAIECDFEKLVTELSIPTLYVGGSKPNADFATLRQWNPAIQLEKVTNSGHYITVFAAEQVNHYLRQFLTQ